MRNTVDRVRTYCSSRATRLLVAGLVCLAPGVTRCEVAVVDWYRTCSGTGDMHYLRTVAVDSSNNVVVAGQTSHPGVGLDFVTIKYSSDGVPLWTNYFNGTGNADDTVYALAVDRSDNIVVAGQSVGSGSGLDYLVLKYSSDGMPLWTNRFKTSGVYDDHLRDMRIDSQDDVIVTGYAIGATTMYDFLTIKCSSSGKLLWSKRYNGPATRNDYAYGMAVRGTDIIVTGQARYWCATNATDDCFATVKYSGAGTELWTRLYHGPEEGTEYGYTAAFDNAGSVIVSGISVGFGYTNDFFTIKYSSTGTALWTQRYNGPGIYSEHPNAVAVDRDNNIIVAGDSSGGTNDLDYLVVKYASSGTMLWARRYNGPGNGADHLNAMTLDASNNVVVTGYSRGKGTGSDAATIKYSGSGEPLWIRRFSQPYSSDWGIAIAVDHSNSVVVAGGFNCGYTNSAFTGNNLLTIRYTCLPCLPLPVLHEPSIGDGTLQLRIDEVLPNGVLVIESSPDLLLWTPVATNHPSDSSLLYTAPAPGGKERYFRARQSPD